MLSSKEKSLAVVLLDLLPPSDLLGLATTVTKNLIVVNTKDGMCCFVASSRAVISECANAEGKAI